MEKTSTEKTVEKVLEEYERDRKLAAEIVDKFQEQNLTIKAAKNVMDLVVVMIETSKVSPQKA